MRGSGLAVAMLAVALVTACGPGEPEPGPPSSSAPSGPTLPDDPPPVTDPLDISPFAERPCDLLTPEQLIGFGFPPDEEPGVGSSGAPADYPCVWQDRDDRFGQLAIYVFAESDALGEAYDQALFEESRELTIGDHPALEERAEGSFNCTATVGLAPEQGMRVVYGMIRPPHDRVCQMVRAVAEAIVANLRDGR